MSVEEQVQRLMADAKAAAFDDALERLARAWRDYADRYDTTEGWGAGEDPDSKRLRDLLDSQGNVNEDVTINLERSIRDVLGVEHDEHDNLAYAPPSETSDAIVERLRFAWNARVDVFKNVNDLGPRAHARAYDAARVALEDAVRDLVGGPRPAYRHSNSR